MCLRKQMNVFLNSDDLNCTNCYKKYIKIKKGMQLVTVICPCNVIVNLSV